jgi:CBS domain-containing protein
MGDGNAPSQRHHDAEPQHVNEVPRDDLVTVRADDDVNHVLQTMNEHKVRRVPVLDGHDLVGIVAQADVARSLPKPAVGDLVDAVSSD